MELEIKDLVEGIRKDGILKANEEAEAILASARKQAETIVADAEAKASSIVEKANTAAKELSERETRSANQAKRDTLLSVVREVEDLFKCFLKDAIKKEINGKALLALIEAAVKDEDLSKSEVLVSEVAGEIKNEISKLNELEIHVSKDVASGFVLKAKDGSFFMDVNEKTLADVLMPYFGKVLFE